MLKLTYLVKCLWFVSELIYILGLCRIRDSHADLDQVTSATNCSFYCKKCGAVGGGGGGHGSIPSLIIYLVSH